MYEIYSAEFNRCITMYINIIKISQFYYCTIIYYYDHQDKYVKIIYYRSIL